MANNRLWAVCKADGRAACLGKYYQGGWGPIQDRDDFFQEHDKCEGNRGCGENITFVDEFDERVELYDYRNAPVNEVKIIFKK